jgi:hypothetical protein
MKKLILSIALTSIAASLLTGCGSSSESKSPSKEDISSNSEPIISNDVDLAVGNENVDNQEEIAVDLITDSETIDELVIDDVSINDVVIEDIVINDVTIDDVTTDIDIVIEEQARPTVSHQTLILEMSELTTENALQVTTDALNVINHVMRQNKSYINFESDNTIVGYSEQNYSNTSFMYECGNRVTVTSNFIFENYNLSNDMLLNVNEKVSYAYDKCALPSNNEQMYIDGSKSIEVISGTYTESGLNGANAITNISFNDLGFYSANEQYGYIDGNLLIGTDEGVMTIKADNLSVKDSTLLMHETDYKIEHLEMDITKTINQIGIFSTYEMNSEPFSVHGGHSGMKYTVNVTDPIIINEQVLGATAAGKFTITSETGVISVDIRGSYARFSIDVDGDGITDLNDTIDYINYR